MATVYSVRLLAQHDVGIANPAQYTVPVGKLAIVRDIDAYNGDVVGDTMYAVVALSPQVVFFQASWGVGERGWRSWRGRQVLYAGDTLSVFADRVIDVVASGYLLSV